MCECVGVGGCVGLCLDCVGSGWVCVGLCWDCMGSG